MDALSEALNSVRMTSAIFFNAICTAPWGFAAPHMKHVAHALSPGTERLVGYHLVTEGKAVVGFDDGVVVPIEAGDIVINPHGDAHTVTNGSPSTLIDSAHSLRQNLAGSLTTMKLGGGGELTHFVCGYFGCDRHADHLFLAGLPRMIKINIRGDAAGEWLESSIRHLVCEAESGRPGQSVLLSKMAEALFIETLRRYMDGCRRNRPAGSPARATLLSGRPSLYFTENLASPGAWTGSRQRPGRHARCWQSDLRGFWVNRRWRIWRAGACSLPRGGFYRLEAPSFRSRRMSATSPRLHSTAHSSVNSGCRRRSIAERSHN